ncbi:hypothetical protein EYC84_006694 [Monilinia fructicola]|uniref:Uncharacterized protein n=1 Tax=Monilinia fructicola TaxID=38448 RepID=A0A5M9K8N3_MONFR|nr:hypothetical protein EYC84_006694 [Monilinia fructicola]
MITSQIMINDLGYMMVVIFSSIFIISKPTLAVESFIGQNINVQLVNHSELPLSTSRYHPIKNDNTNGQRKLNDANVEEVFFHEESQS